MSGGCGSQQDWNCSEVEVGRLVSRSASWTTQPESAPFAICMFKKNDRPRPALGSLTAQEGS